MADDPNPHALSQRGFTLIETLVALSVASILIATLIPISRNSLFRVLRLDEDAQTLKIFDAAVLSASRNQPADGLATGDVKVSVAKRPLPPFQYDRDQQERWQPVLVIVETRGPSGALMRTELIRLEREAP